MPPPPRTPKTFQEILELIWWRLDKALDLEMIEWSAKLGALEALERGTTAIIDHHASPNAIEGSLSVIADACAEIGVRLSTCYEVTDRNGLEEAKAGLEENKRYLQTGGRGYVGAHACFTLSDDTLDAVCALASKLGVGVHIHVAEGPEDVDAGKRLEGRARDNWLLVHAVHLDRELSGTIAHNPLSNMNNAVGYAAPASRPNRIVLGTDGIGGDMIEAFRMSYLRRARPTSRSRRRPHGAGSKHRGICSRKPRATGLRGLTSRWSPGTSLSRRALARSMSRSTVRKCSWTESPHASMRPKCARRRASKHNVSLQGSDDDGL